MKYFEGVLTHPLLRPFSDLHAESVRLAEKLPRGRAGRLGLLTARRNGGTAVRHALAVALVVVGSAILSASAQAYVPIIVNSPNANWAETGAREDERNRSVWVTFLARHDEGRRITSVVTSSGTFDVTSQYLGTDGNSVGTNRMASSVVRFRYTPPVPSGFTCSFFGGGTRRVDQTLAFSVRDDIGQQSSSVSQSVRVIDDDACAGEEDFPTLTTVGQSAPSAIPGQDVTFTFVCDDADETGTNDRCDYIQWRNRRLNDGSVSSEIRADADDNVTRSFSSSFPARGVWVVEARLCGEDFCEDGSWWRIGTVAVNETAIATPELMMNGAGVVSGAGGYSVNADDPASAVATVSDSGLQGAVQAIAWSSGRFDYATPQLSGNTVVQSLAPAQRTHGIDTSTSGVKTISAVALDNGAIDGADSQRRQSLVASASIRVNARPTASDISTTTSEDTATAISLQGADADSQPAPLTYEIVSQPAKGSLSLSGDTVTFTPQADFHGTTAFTYRAKDGPVADAAWSDSNTATVTVTVASVNDPPSLGGIADRTVDEGVALRFTISAIDADGDALTYSASNLPSGASFDAETQTFTWTPAFDQAGSYQNVRFDASDGDLTDSQDITITVNDKALLSFSGFFAPVNNPPTLNTVKAGAGIPVKFSLAGDQGLDVFVAGYPVSERIECDGAAAVDVIEETVTTDGSRLLYDPSTDQYIFLWKTSKNWADTCRSLVLKLSDESDHVALFEFR